MSVDEGLLPSHDPENIVDVNVSGVVYKVEARVLSLESEFFAEQIDAYKLVHGGKYPGVIIVEGGHSPTTFLPLLRYMKFKEIEEAAAGNPDVIRLAKYLRIHGFTDSVSALREYAVLLVMHPRMEWFVDQENGGIQDGKQLVVRIDHGPEPVFTTLVDGLNWVHRNRFTVDKYNILSKDAPTSEYPYIASLTLSRVIEPSCKYNETDEVKEFALLLSRYGTEGAHVIMDTGGDEWTTIIEGCVRSEFARVAADICDFDESVRAMNWLGSRGFKDREKDLDDFLDVIRGVMVQEGIVRGFTTISLWSRIVAGVEGRRTDFDDSSSRSESN
jgi:hypothetical protein